MTLNFVKPVININGNNTENNTLTFYKTGFRLNGVYSPEWQDITVSGENKLNLVNAKAYGLNYLKLFGKCTQGDLPDDYTLLEYVTNSGSNKVSTGVIPMDGDELEIEFYIPETSSSNASFYALQARETSSSHIYGITGSANGNLIAAACGGTTASVAGVTRTAGNRYIVKASYINETLTVYAKNITTDTERTKTSSYTWETPPSDLDYCIFGNTIGQVLNQPYNFYYAKITNNGTLRLNCIPAKNSSDVIGFYDTVSNTFKTPGSGVLTAGAEYPNIDTSVNIKCNNGVLKVNAQGQVYADGTTETVQTKDKNNTVLSTATAQNLLAIGEYKDIQNVTSGDITRKIGIMVLDGTETWDTKTTRCFNLKKLITTNPIICNYFRFSSTLPAAEDRTGVVFNSIYGAAFGSRTDDYFPTKADWTSWLAQKYAEGNPVIVVYVLDEPVEETATAQDMTINAGENTIEISQASINLLPLEAQYKAGVEVTIEEVEEANLDNNVTVTIGE